MLNKNGEGNMKKKKWWLITISILAILGIGGKIYMDNKDKQELHEIQTDLAEYLYNNYRLYTFDKTELEELDKEYNQGKGQMSFQEYSKKVDEIAIYSDIKKIEFTGFSVGPMKGLVVEFVINNVYPDETTLDTISAETNNWIYSIDSGNTRNNYVLEEKETPTKLPVPEKAIVYYDVGIE